MEKIRITGRSSRLSLLQMVKVRDKIEITFPELEVELIAGSSRGDALQDIPLQSVEGTDFFTREIFDKLTSGEADIAVHSLKDMSSEHFFGSNEFAVIDRDDVRDVSIFSKNVLEKIKNGEEIVIGTCSPRREEMATDFLQRALPQLNNHFKVITKFIRGNIDTRLRKLDSGEYDGIILATAGLNRLLSSKADSIGIKKLLADKLLMLLPLIECVPAPCQGAIVAEAHHTNKRAIEVLKKINEPVLYADCLAEKKEAIKYGAGCIQKFGVTTLDTRNGKYVYAAGKDAEGTEFVKWDHLPGIKIEEDKLFVSTNVMKDFFDYEWDEKEVKFNKPVIFIANYKAIQKSSAELLQHKSVTQQKLNRNSLLGSKIILASGTKTWFELAKKGYWVTASADALGFEFLLPALQMPLLKIQRGDISILTHETGAARWRDKGYDSVSNYKLIPKNLETTQLSIGGADAIFWSSFSQFEYYGKFAKPHAKHVCSGGETAELLKAAGIKPVIFPTIKSFQQWRNSSIRSHSVA